jgi:ketosteroid isomerase-like protein
MPEERNIRFVRSIWEAIRESGIEAALEKAPGVEWRPHAAGGLVLTTEEALTFFADFQGERELLEVVPYSYHAHGDFVLASGSFRLRGPGRISEFQIHWVYEFEGDRLLRATSFATRAEALEAIGVDEI